MSTSQAASRMDGKVCLITGATRGLGLATAVELAKLGAQVVIAGRDPMRIDTALDTIRRQAPDSTPDSLMADLSSMKQTRTLADTFVQRYGELDVLINNAGGTFLKHARSEEGNEHTWALNYLSQFLLTRLLVEPLRRAAAARGEARVLGIASNMYRMSKPAFAQPPQRARYNGVYAYAQSKRAMIMSTRSMAQRLDGTGICINAMTPGLVATSVASNNHGWAVWAMRFLHLFATPLEKGVQPIVRLAASPDVREVSGQYFVKFQQRPPYPTCGDPAQLDALWRTSSAATGLPVEMPLA